MTKVLVVAGGVRDHGMLPPAEAYVGVDRGCLALLTKGLPLDVAVGDFDSVTTEEYQLIQTSAKLMVTASAEKDDTDLELALKQVFAQWPEAEVTVYGALGGRLDHTLSNVFLPSHPDLAPFMGQISLVDQQNKVRFYPSGQQVVQTAPDYAYVAFLLEGQGQLEIKGAKYELSSANYFYRKIYSSNEFIDRPVEVFVPSGYLVVIYSKDR